MPIDLSALPDQKPEEEKVTTPGGIDLSALPDQPKAPLRQQYRTDNTSPDQEAKVFDLGKRTGMPIPVIRSNVDKVQKLADEPDWDEVGKQSPKFAKLLTQKPDLFRVAKDDIVPIGAFERTIAAAPAAIASGTLAISEGILRIPEAAQRFSGAGASVIERTGLPPVLNPLRGAETIFGAIADFPGEFLTGPTAAADAVARARRLLSSDPETFPEAFSRLGIKGEEADVAFRKALSGDVGALGDVFTDPEAVAGFVGQAAPSLILAALSGGSIPFIAMLEGTAKASDIAEFERITGFKITDEDFALAVAQTAALNAVLEKTGLDKVLQQSGPGVLAKLGKILGATLAEGGTEAAQELNANLATLMTFDAEQSLSEGILASFIGGAGSGSIMSTVNALTTGSVALAEKEVQASRAERIKQVAENLFNAAKESKLRQRSEDAFEDTVEAIAENTELEDAYFDADTLVEFYEQQGVPIEVAFEELPEVKRQLDEVRALGDGGDILIPIEKVATHLVDRPEDVGLVDHIRFDAKQMSNFEAQSYQQSKVEELAEEANRIMGENVQDELFAQSVERVETQAFEALEQAGRFNSDVNRSYASMVSNFYTVYSDKLGISPEEMATQYPLNVRGIAEKGPAISFKQFDDKVDADLVEFAGRFDPTIPSQATQLDKREGVAGEPSPLTDEGQIQDDTQEEAQPAEESANENLFQSGVNDAPMDRAQKNNIGLFSAVEQAVIDMNLPEWGKKAPDEFAVYLFGSPESFFKTRSEAEAYVQTKFDQAIDKTNTTADGRKRWEIFTVKKPVPVSGKQIWQKLSKMPGVKKEELETLGLEEFLNAGDKFTREDVRNFVQSNGVEIEEVVASDERTDDEVHELEWDSGRVWDDPEAWEHEVEDALHEFDSGSNDSAYVQIDEFMEQWINDHLEEMIANYESTLDADVMAQIEALPEAGKSEALINLLNDHQFDPLEDMRAEARDEFETRVERTASEVYFENPIYIYGTEGNSADIDLWIFGNDDQGYSIRENGWEQHSNDVGLGEIFSLNEAQVQADGYARDNDLITSEFDDDNDTQIARWKQFTLDSEDVEDSYREIKLTLPNNPGQEFYEEAHFPDANIVTFLRVTDREFPTDSKEVDSEGGIGREEKKTYMIDEMQSDWHQAGRQFGYKDGSVDPGELDQQAQTIRLEVKNTINDLFVKLRVKEFGEESNVSQAFEIPARFENGESAGFVQIGAGKFIDMSFIILEDSDDNLSANPKHIAAKNWITERLEESELDLPDLSEKVKQIGRLENQIRIERNGVTDAPFKGNAWLELGLKRAIVDAVENGYEAIAWADSNVLADRWSERYLSMYSMQYDKKMPSFAKKITGTKPKHLVWGTGQEHGSEFGVFEIINATEEAREDGFDVEGRPDTFQVIGPGFSSGIFNTREEAENEARIQVSHGKAKLGYWTIPITDELRDRVKADGLPLFQGSNRGLFTPETDTITLLEGADLSTFIHEFGHWQLEVIADLASKHATPQTIKDDMQTLLDWFGVEDVNAWNKMTLDEKRDSHEKFARGFEAYLFKGDVPNSKMAEIFARFRNWLVRVYKQLKNLNVKLTPEVTEVFDRLVATEDQIAEHEQLQGYRQLFKSEAEAEMTPDQYRKYQNEAGKGTEDAVNDLQDRAMRDMKWLRNARNRELKRAQAEAKEQRQAIRDEVEAEVMAEPIQQAIRFLKKGEIETDEEIKVTKGHRLDIAALEQMYPETQLGNPDWKSLPKGNGGVVGRNGLHPDIVAPVFGFNNGDDLVASLLTAENANEKIEAITDQRMLERHAELSDPESIQRAADRAIHNDARSRFIATELIALEKATGQKKTLLRAARQYAKEIIGKTEIRDMRKTNRHAVTERKAGRAAEMALRNGERDKAARHKRTQLISNLMYRESLRGKDDVAKMLRRFDKFNKPGTRKNLEQSYLDQIDQLLERYDLRVSVSQKDIDRRLSLNEWIKDQQAEGIDPAVPDRLVSDARRIHYSRLTLDEMRGLYDSVRSIEHIGRMKKKLLTAKDKREFDQAIDETVASIEKNATKKIKQQMESNGTFDGVRELKNEFFAMHRKAASLARQMDGLKDGGKVWELLIRPMNEASDREASMREKATIDMDKIFRPLYKQGRMNRKIDIPGTNDGTGKPKRLSIEGRIVVALNAGNAVNWDRLVVGGISDGWSEADFRAVLDSLTEQEADAVQAVWDNINGYWPEIAALERRITGVAPEKVEAEPVTMAGKQYRGGYYPIKYNVQKSRNAKAHSMADIYEQLKQAGRTNATTKKGHTKARAESGNGVLDYSLSGLWQHMDEVIHDLVWREWAIDSGRVLRDSRFDDAVRKHYGPEMVELWRKAQEDNVLGDMPARNPFERIINHLRVGVTIVGMGWNLFTSALQPLGLTQSMARIGPGHVGRGLTRWLASGKDMEDSTAWVYAKSDFMRLRGKTLQREINEIRNKVAGKKLTDVQNSYFYLIMKLQQVADMPTWIGQYHKSMEAGETSERAAKLADQAVRDSQGGGQISDLAQIQRGPPLLKIWTNFYSYFNVTWQLTAERVSQTNFRKPASIGRLAVDFLLLYTLPATLAAMLREAIYAITGGADDDELSDEDLIVWLARENLSYMTGVMVGLRELSSVAQGSFGYSGPAGTRFFNDLSQLSTQVFQGEVDEAALKALNKVAGIMLHYPAGQVERAVEGAVAIAEEETINPLVLTTGTQ